MTQAAAVSPSKPVSVKLGMALAGAIAVALAAQIALPIPGSPVPFTLQPLAVLIVGGLLGPRYGALSLVMYLAMGTAGLPVFAPFGAPGFARLLGPTGGFLLAFPVAAYAVGRYGGRAVGKSGTALPSYRRTALACLLGMAIIFAGGAAQLMILNLDAAILLTPFLIADGVKAGLAALVIRRYA